MRALTPRRAVLGGVLLLTGMLLGPRPVAADPIRVDALAVGTAWDATSGYGALEAQRATTAQLIIVAPWDATSGYGAVEASRTMLSDVVQP